MVLRAVVEARRVGLFETRVTVVVSDRPSPIEAFCERHGIDFELVQLDHLSVRLKDLRERKALDWLGLTFNRLLKSEVIQAFGYRILNLHLSLLPQYPGFHPTAKALANGDDVAGATVHLIDPGIDTGPILGQAICSIADDDTVAKLGRRQFEVAVPLVLQIVRAIESRSLIVEDGTPAWKRDSGSLSTWPTIIAIDGDISSFAKEFCARIKS